MTMRAKRPGKAKPARPQAVPPAETGEENGDIVGLAPALHLERFLPYRLAVLANRISRKIANAYDTRFGLSIPEWRVMAILGRFPDVSANEVADLTAMDKVRVSRAVASLIETKRIDRSTDEADRRRSCLRLSAEGLAIYRQIVPLAQAYERQLLDHLSPAEQVALDSLVTRLMDLAEGLQLPDLAPKTRGASAR